MPEANGFNEVKTQKWFESTIAHYAALFIFLAPIVMFIFGIKTDIALIQQSIQNINSNHEQHIQDILQQLKDQKAEMATQQGQIIELQKQILLIIKK